METLAVKINNLHLSYGTKDILSIEELSVYQHEKIGIIGANGSGKTSLLKLLAGKDKAIKKEIDFAYFSQIGELTQTANEELDFELMSRLSVPDRADNFSGGEETKFRLAQVLSSYPTGILLDEPTTHLDEESVQVLIDELQYYYGTLIFVSHNRYFLNQLADKIWEVKDGKVTEYVGNYDSYKEQIERKELELSRAHESYLKEKERLSSAVQKKKEQAQNMSKVSAQKKKNSIKPDRLSSSKQKDTAQKAVEKSAKAIEKRLEQLEEVQSVGKQKKIVFPTSKHLEIHNKYPIRAEKLSIEKGGKILLKNADFQFQLGKKTAIIGKNGIGKSSLLKAILSKEDGIILSPKVQILTYEQMDYKLVEDTSVLKFLMNRTEFPESLVRSILHNLGFIQDELGKSLKSLSGGEATRISLALLFVQPSNVLILDEPTNFIDLTTIEALENFLKSYQGTVLFSSHDRYFVERVADEVVEIEGFTLRKV